MPSLSCGVCQPFVQPLTRVLIEGLSTASAPRPSQSAHVLANAKPFQLGLLSEGPASFVSYERCSRKVRGDGVWRCTRKGRWRRRRRSLWGGWGCSCQVVQERVSLKVDPAEGARGRLCGST
eukprot:1533366-Pleurochrysis_carterae.AAC.5